ncbi:DNA (cytosine-5)-methyltransferase 1 [Paraburkholderia steynii]|uniref:DNA (cytosine-5-)-methyltransferase n=2 Tax=Paraburkholderia steynii TaxID=1245441 RepID=A0A7Z7BLU1_9BURK|nr:DNA (cytosine-5)-methyltransferase 1 [Paraburkholderia steynii]
MAELISAPPLEQTVQRPALPYILSLFCGPGGLDLGFKKAGFRIALAIDRSAAAVNTHKRNFPRSKSICADIVRLGPRGVVRELLDAIPDGVSIGVIGGPPCQGFSRANNLSHAKDPRNVLPALYIEIVRELQAHFSVEFVVFENVLGIKDRKHVRTYDKVVTKLGEADFDVNEFQLSALDFGVPQKRERVILIGTRASAGHSAVVLEKRKGKQTVREAIHHLDEPTFFQRGLSSSDISTHPNHWTMNPKSKRFSTPPQRWKPSRSFKRLTWDEASPTIAFGNREIHVHPSCTRRLSIYEAMLLQGFPDNYVLEGNFSEQVEQVSNAVPPPLGQAVALGIRRAIKMNGRKK